MKPLTPLQKRLLDRFQDGFPLRPRPYRHIAETLGVSESAVLAALADLDARGVLSRIGAVFDSRRLGASTLAAVEVPPERIESVCARIDALPGVSHNYLREDALNVWFVAHAEDEAALDALLTALEQDVGLPILRLPMEAAYHIDLSFPVDEDAPVAARRCA
ncbi:MAG: protein NirD [Gammaproteobacteria bacterium]|nr:MAG: protein NirD [Gammaproteobacteria bacterium]